MPYAMNCEEVIQKLGQAHIDAQREGLANNHQKLGQAAQWIAESLESGHKILLFGNGGSAADSQHIAAEFVNRFRLERRPLPAIALTTDTSIITAIGNDYGFDQIFEKQVAALGRPKDIAVGISTSGTSKNVILGLRAASSLGLRCIGFSGGRPTEMDDLCDLILKAATADTPRVQETHILFGHIICDLVERMLFKEVQR